MFGRIAALVVSLVVAAPGRGHAAFHIALISEVMSGAGGDPAAQYVMVRMGSPMPQNAVASSVLAAFSCDGTVRQDLLVVPGNVTAFGPGVPWIMASQSPIGGIVPDF